MERHSFLLLSALSFTFAAPGSKHESLFAREDTFLMASVGDSWAAGAAVTGGQMYDDNGKCLRNKVAWEAQMAGDNTWTDSPIDFKFLACSGAQLQAAAAGDPDNGQPEPQLSSAGSPHLLTMELGGNNCHFSDIARACLYVGGLNGKEYPDPDSSCTQTINQWQAYITGDSPDEGKSLYADHHKALQAILDWDTIHGRDDFYLYVVGYAEFFNTSPDSNWCDKETFGMVRHPRLTNELRSKINELVRGVNDVIDQSIKDVNNDHIKFLNPSPLYEGHRFCEPGHTLSNQYFLNDVWFWNLSPPEDDPDYFNIFILPLQIIHQEMWIQNQTFPNGTQATQEQIEAMVGGSNPYSSGRTFHPKDGGHTAIKDGMIALLRENKVPGVKQAAPTTPPKQQPYASGRVHIHIREFWGCLDDANNLSIEIEMWDSANTQIGYTKRTQAGASASARMGSKLENELVVTPEWAKGGYIQFALGDLQFNTNDDRDNTKDVFCNVGGYDPREGPQCYIPVPEGAPIYDPDAVAIAQMDCYFPAVSSFLSPRHLEM